VLKYVRFRDLKQLENDRLCELIDMIEYSLPPIVCQQDLNLHRLVLPINHDQSTEAKPIVITLENQDISSKSDPFLR
jgi:hypothetical protein